MNYASRRRYYIGRMRTEQNKVDRLTSLEGCSWCKHTVVGVCLHYCGCGNGDPEAKVSSRDQPG
jgi:hypothetical protein